MNPSRETGAAQKRKKRDLPSAAAILRNPPARATFCGTGVHPPITSSFVGRATDRVTDPSDPTSAAPSAAARIANAC